MGCNARRAILMSGMLALGACGVLTTREESVPSAWDLPAPARAYFRVHHPPSAERWDILGPFASPYDGMARDLLLGEGGERNAAPSSHTVTIPPNVTATWHAAYARRHDAWNPQPFLTRYAGYVPIRTGECGMGPETALAHAEIESPGGLHRLVLRPWGSARMLIDGQTSIERVDFHEFFGQREAFAELAPGSHRVLVKLENLAYNAQEDAAKVFGSWGFTLTVARAGMLADGLYVDVPWVADALPGDTAVMGLGAVRAVKAPPSARIALTVDAGTAATTLAVPAPPPGEVAFVPFVVSCGEERLPERLAVRSHAGELFGVDVPRGASRDALLLRAIVAPSDLSLQPYLLYLPPEKVEAPLIVYLHGGTTTEEELAAWPSGVLDLAAAHGCAVCAPRAREGAMLSAQAESDILLAVRDAAYAARADAAAPFVAVGSGRGAAAALQLACRYPHLVRAVVAVAVNPFEPEPAFADALRRLGPMARNLAGKRVLLIAGERERGSAEARRALAGFGALLTAVEPQGRPLAGAEAASAFAACLAAPADSPTALAFTTTRRAWHDAWWISIDAFEREASPATVTMRPAAGGGRIEIESDNALRLRIAPARLPGALRGATTILWNGKEAYRGALADPLVLGTESSGARPDAAPSLDELLRANHVCVAPHAQEQRTAAQRLLGRGAARARVGRNAGTWSTEVLGPADGPPEAASNVILFGGPAENAVTAAFAPRVAPALTATTFTLAGQSFTLAEHVVFLVAADPESPGRLVAILAGGPLARFAERCADSPVNPLAFPERAPAVIVWRLPPDGDAVFEAARG